MATHPSRDRSLSPLIRAKPLYMGILGSTDTISKDLCYEKVIEPILASLECLPSRVILPSEGNSSLFVDSWAETNQIPTEVYTCEWARHGKRAKIWRDNRIIQESTIFVVFLNKKSNFYETTATRLAKKGNRVFVVSYGDFEVSEFVVEAPAPKNSKKSKSKPILTNGPMDKFLKQN
jgi:hypothetical protein